MKTLSESVLDLNLNRTSRFFRGGEFPVPVPQISLKLDEEVAVEWREFGLGFDVTLIPSQTYGRLAWRIEGSVSEPDTGNGITLNGMFVPGISRRRFQSTVTLPPWNEGMLAILNGRSEKDTRLLFCFKIEDANARVSASDAIAPASAANQD